ncbi:hypothetical protein ABGB12_03250 [Actinocorallia sp. B10E7]|uniref:bestrophin-like domain n=1 Tax=Actinocorallia sp. B10E7 TaxID=3153558 RepID=UPI00325D9C40
METAVAFRELVRITSFLATLPAWLSGLLLIVGLPMLVAGLQALIRRHFPVLGERRHNDVAGFLLAVIGVIYAVSAGFILVDLHENRVEAKNAARSEAFSLMAIAQTSQVMGKDAQQRIVEHVLAYEKAVVESWPPGKGSPMAPLHALDRLLTEISRLQPTNATQAAFVAEATRELMEVSVAHQELDIGGREGYLDTSLWVAMLISSSATLAFCLLFGLENARLHYLMVAGVTTVIAVNLFLMVQLNHPFKGDLAVQPNSHQYVVRELER